LHTGGSPDTAAPAEAVLALRRTARGSQPAGGQATDGQATDGQATGGRHPAIGRGLRWITGMQSKDGGWGAFDADNTSTIVTKLPFCDFGAVIDPPSADVTAHVVEALAPEGLAASRAGRRGAGRRRPCPPAGRPAAAWSGCCARRRRTAPGSAGGARTTSTAPARWCRR